MITLIPTVQVFDENELEYLMCGITQIDVEDWKTYTDFKGGYSASHHVVVWFWKVSDLQLFILKYYKVKCGLCLFKSFCFT